jgi:hypothetical protein
MAYTMNRPMRVCLFVLLHQCCVIEYMQVNWFAIAASEAPPTPTPPPQAKRIIQTREISTYVVGMHRPIAACTLRRWPQQNHAHHHSGKGDDRYPRLCARRTQCRTQSSGACLARHVRLGKTCCNDVGSLAVCVGDCENEVVSGGGSV